MLHINMRSVIQNSLRHGIFSARRPYHASVLSSLISPSSPEFIAKADAMDSLVREIENETAIARQGGGPKAIERMRSKGKKLPRER